MSRESSVSALAPHAPLQQYYTRESDRQSFVRQIFDQTAVDYDRIEWAMAMGSGSRYRREALQRAGLAKGMAVLDVGTGTGLVARQAAAIVGDPKLVTGLDPSAGMLAQAVASLPICVIRAGAEHLPLASGTFDFLSMGYALRHVADLTPTFREFHRVLKPGGTICLLEITRPTGRLRTAMIRWYMRSLVPLISRIASRSRQSPRLWEYYWDTIEACVPPARVVEAIAAAGFTDVKHHVQWGLFSEYTARKGSVT